MLSGGAASQKHGYPSITPALRAQVFGLNATRPYRIDAAEVQKRARMDDVSRRRVAYRERPDPTFLTYGPKTRREFLALASTMGASAALATSLEAWRAAGVRPDTGSDTSRLQSKPGCVTRSLPRCARALCDRRANPRCSQRRTRLNGRAVCARFRWRRRP